MQRKTQRRGAALACVISLKVRRSDRRHHCLCLLAYGAAALDDDLVQGAQIRLGRSDQRVRIGGTRGHRAALVRQSDRDLGLRVGALGHRVHLIEFELRLVRNERLDRVKARINRTIARSLNGLVLTFDIECERCQLRTLRAADNGERLNLDPVLARTDFVADKKPDDCPGQAKGQAAVAATDINSEPFKTLVADPAVLAIVVRGEGRAFSAGFDLKEGAARGTKGAEAWRAVLQADFDFIMRFWDCPKPTVAALLLIFRTRAITSMLFSRFSGFFM